MSNPIYLRALETSDLERCHTWHNDRNLYDTLVGPFRFVSKQAEQAWLERRTTFSSNEVNLAICTKKSDMHIGNIYLREIDWISRRAKMEIFIGEINERSKGYGQSAIRELLSHAFGDLGLKRIYLSVLADNDAALKVYKKCGFIVEGRLRNHVFKKSGWKDLVVMGLCSDDYNNDNGTKKS